MSESHEKKETIETTDDQIGTKRRAGVSPSWSEPCAEYPKVPGIDCALFNLPSKGLSREHRQRALAQFQAYETTQMAHFLGYQANQDLHYQNDLKEFLDFHLNNIGDPFVEGNFTVNSKMMERAVLDYYASLWRAKWPHNQNDPDSYWGYVLSMGSSEGNLYGLWNARDYLAGKVLLNDSDLPGTSAAAHSPIRRHRVYKQSVWLDNPNAYTPIAFFSADTHYSIIKAMRVLAIQTFYDVGTEFYPDECPLGTNQWPQEVPSKDGQLGPGSIDVDALEKLVRFFAARGYPILVSFNYGTTFKGAYDDVEEAGKRLMPIFKEYGLDERKVEYRKGLYDKRTGYWFHIDGALGAAYMPFIEMAYDQGRIEQRGSNFDFRLSMVHSIVMSGHKWIGAPWPCGIYMTRVKMQIKPPDDPSYIGSPDTTFASSRNGFSPMIFWDYLATHSYEEQIEKALRTEALCVYAQKKLLELQDRLKTDLWIQRSPLSLTVLFKAASDEVIMKYSLSGEELVVDGVARNYSHIFMVESVTKARIDELISDLAQPGGIPDQKPSPVGASKAALDAAARPLIHVPTSGRGFK
jgi:histidine decarboxylase